MSVLWPFGRWVRATLVHQSRWRAFVGWQAYYQPYLGNETGRALIQHNGPYVGDDARQTELVNGLDSGRRAALVWAPPGCGKSRFAIEVAPRLERSYKVVFVQHDDAAVREELPQLTQMKSVVFVVDDAHECVDLVRLLASACAQAPSSAELRLVCLTRSTGRAEVSRAINSAFPPGALQEIDLGRPSAVLVRSLIDKLLPKSSPHHRETIARFVRQSYFGAVMVCTLLGRQQKLPQTFQRQDLRDRVCREPLREAVGDVCPIETAVRVLAVFTALAPVPRAGVEAREVAAQLNSLPAAKVEALIERVVAAGLFQEDGRGAIRPVPDLLGDLILEEACLDVQGRPTPYSGQLLERLFEVDPLATVRNCAEIGQLFGTGQDADMVSTLILTRMRSVAPERRWDVLRLLRASEPLSSRRPGTALEVASILETRGILRRDPPASELYGPDSVEMITCRMLMHAGEVDPVAVPLALQLGRDLWTAAQGDARSEAHVRDTLRTYCRFEMGRNLSHAQAVVTILRGWINDSSPLTAALAATLSGQFLTLQVEGQTGAVAADEGTASPQPTLNPLPEVWAVRDIAVEALTRGLAHTDLLVQSSTVQALNGYASSQVAPDRTALDAWRPQLSRETEALSTALIQRIGATSSLALRAMAEQLAWLWWAHEFEPLRRAGQAVLEAIPDADPYRLWKSLHATRLPALTVAPKDFSTEVAARVHYLQSLATLEKEQAVARAAQLFNALDPGSADTPAWRKLWMTVFEQVPRMPLDENAGVVVGEFARRHADAAWSFINEADAKGPLFAVLPFLLVELGKLDRARRSEEARTVRAGTELEQAWLVALWDAPEPNEAEQTLVARGLASTDLAVLYRAAATLLSANPAELLSAFRLVFGAVGQHPAEGELWELVIARFVQWGEGVLPPTLAAPHPNVGVAAAELMRLLQAKSGHIRWGFQNHTRQLTSALAIFAVVAPRELQGWMRLVWGQGQSGRGGSWDDASPLSARRFVEVMRLVKQSSVASHWIEVFGDWLKRETHLGAVAAIGLVELCALDDPRVTELVLQIAAQPSETALQSFAEFIRQQRPNSSYPRQALALLEACSSYPDAYPHFEAVILESLVNPVSGRSLSRPSPAQVRALQAVEAYQAQGSASPLFLASLGRAERELHAAMEDDSAPDEQVSQA